MRIDFHTHCFPDNIAGKALPRLSDAAGGLRYHTDGTVDGLKSSMRIGGVDTSVVLHIATNAHQQHSVNDFAASIHDGTSIISFGSVFPDSPDALQELERIKSLGLPGVKLHPDYQGFFVDDPKMKPIYEKISQLGLITLFHAGYDYGFPPPYHCTPERMRNALRWFSAPVVAAHWGGCNLYDDVLTHLCGTDIYFDTSFGYGIMPKYYAERILEHHGTGKLLFGTDTPWHTPDMELRLLRSLRLSESELEAITFQNAAALLKLSPAK